MKIAIATIIFLLGLYNIAEVKSHGGYSGNRRNRCRIVPITTTSCRGVTGSSCTDSTALAALVVAGSNQTTICDRRNTLSVQNITITFYTPNIYCPSFIGLTDVCFLPAVTDTDNCTTLASNATYVQQVCNDQTVLRSRIATPQVRMCLRNAAVTTSRQYTDTNVTLWASIPGSEGILW